MSILQRRRHEKKFSPCKIDIGASERAAQAENNGELSRWSDFAWLIKIPFLDFEKFVLNEKFALRLDQLRFDIIKVDALQRLIDMQLSRFAFVIDAVPIEHAISRVAILLDFDEEIAGADCVKASSRKKHSIAGFDSNGMNVRGDGAIANCFFESSARQLVPQSGKYFGVRIRSGDVPELALRFAAKLLRDVFGRMNLQRKFFLRVEKFDQQRKSFAVGNVAEDRMSILPPKVVQRFTFERSVRDNALRLGSIDNFPRFADAHIRRQFFSEFGFKSAPAPHSFHENRFEGEGTGEIDLAHAAISGTVAAAVRSRKLSECPLHCLVSRRHACHYRNEFFAFSQILAAGFDLARLNLYRFDGSDVG